MNKEESLALFAKGQDAWNTWAKGMLKAREALEADGNWVEDRNQHRWNEETRSWHDAASADFSITQHRQDMDFSHFVFPGDARFGQSTFWKTARFQEVNFLGETQFLGATFREEGQFWGAIFESNAPFDGAVFLRGASFRGATFSENFSFHGAKFMHGANFDGANFRHSLALVNRPSQQVRLSIRRASWAGQRSVRPLFRVTRSSER